jgi:hypothetical protein
VFLTLTILLQAGATVFSAPAPDTGNRHRAAAAPAHGSPAQHADTAHRTPPHEAAMLVWPRLTMELGSDDDARDDHDDPLSDDGFRSLMANAVLGPAAMRAVTSPPASVAAAPPTAGAKSAPPPAARTAAAPTKPGAPTRAASATTTQPPTAAATAPATAPSTSADAAKPASASTTQVAQGSGTSAGPPRGSPRTRPRAVTYSNGYATRLTIHRVASYAMVPMFICQYITGSQLLAKGRNAPAWALHTHGPLATLTTIVFATNTVTGVWNMWEARHDPAGRTSRTLHGLLMLVSDAGFTTAGILSARARNSSDIRHVHRAVALSSMGVALVGYAIMLPPFRK